MKHLIMASMLLMFAFGTISCDKGGGGIKASKEMTDFMKEFGSSDKIDKALKTFGKKDLATGDMEMYDMKEPKVTAEVKTGAKVCYSLEAKAGMTVRFYDICWEGGKIVEIKSKGMK